MHDPRVLLPVRHHLHAAAVGIEQEQPALELLPRHAVCPQVASSLVQRAVASQLEAGVVVPGIARLYELERVGLVVAREQCAAAVATTREQAELCRPARHSLRDIGYPEADVIDPPQPDHPLVPAATIRSASSSGIASAT